MMSSMFPIAYLKLICFGDSHGVGSRAWSFIPFAKLTRVACLATPKYFSGFTQRPAWASDYGDPFWMECCVGWNHDAQWWLLAMLWIFGFVSEVWSYHCFIDLTNAWQPKRRCQVQNHLSAQMAQIDKFSWFPVLDTFTIATRPEKGVMDPRLLLPILALLAQVELPPESQANDFAPGLNMWHVADARWCSISSNLCGTSYDLISHILLGKKMLQGHDG